MKLLLINTPSYDMAGFRGSPTSLYYVCAPLTNHDSKTFEPFAELGDVEMLVPASVDEYFKYLDSYSKDSEVRALGFSATSHSHWVALQGARRIKSANPNLIVIIGGPHEDEVAKVNNPYLQTLYRWNDIVDIVISGEGEYSLNWVSRNILGARDRLDRREILALLVENAAEISKLPGKGNIDIKNGDSYVRNYLSQEKLNLDMLPPINWSYMGQEQFYNYAIFKDESGRKKKTAQVMTHRGCKGGCRYCSEGQIYNTRSIKNVMKEIDQLIDEHNIKAIFFDDSTFTEEKEYVVGLCKYLRKRDIEWGCLTRYDKLDFELLKHMRCGGCSYIYFGLEQFDGDVLKRIGKKINTETIERTMSYCKSLEIRTGVSCLFGIGESRRVAENTINKVSDWVSKNMLELISLSGNCLHLGSNNIGKLDIDINTIDYDRESPHNGFPWMAFEEGIWHHPREFSENYAWWILENILEKVPLENLVRKDLLRALLTGAAKFY